MTSKNDASPCGFIGEQIAFDVAIRTVLEFAENDSNTLVLITADHSHSTQIIEAGSEDSPGPTATLTTADGALMTISYGTAPAGGFSSTRAQACRSTPREAPRTGSTSTGSWIKQRSSGCLPAPCVFDSRHSAQDA